MMIKMSFAITLILTAILNIVFNFFSSDPLNAKSNAQFIRTHKFQKISNKSSQFVG